MKKILAFAIIFIFAGLFFAKTAEVEASTSVTYSVTGIFDVGGSMVPQTDTINRGSTLSLDLSTATSGHEFLFWIVNGVVNKNLSQGHVFQMTTKMELQAVFVPETKYIAVFVDSNGAYIGHRYTSGGAVSDAGLTMPVERPGFDISSTNKWTSIEGSSSISEVTANSVFVLTYEEKAVPLADVSISISGGSLSTSSTVEFNTLVTATADTAPEGKVFAGWEENGVIVSYQNQYKFSALYNRTLKATFADSVTTRPLVVLSNNLGLRADHSTFVGQFELPSGYTLVEYGVIATDDLLPNLKLSTSVESPAIMKIAQGTNHQAVTKEFVISLPNSNIVPKTTRAYLIVRNALNQIEEYYCEEGLMIFSIYGHGGVNSSSVYNRDYVVLWNGTNQDISLSTYSIQYAGATGTSWGRFILSGTISARGFVLLRLATGSFGSDLPSFSPTLTNSSPNLSGTTGKLALMKTTDTITSGISNPFADDGIKQQIVDFVGFGTANAFENSVAPSLNNASIRRIYLKDNNNNGQDFEQATAYDGLSILFS